MRGGAKSRGLGRALAVVIGTGIVASVLVSSVSPSLADDGKKKIKAEPFTFVGSVAVCGIPGSRIVTAAWLKGLGLPDNGGPNDGTNSDDPRLGLLLSKNGLSIEDCSSAGAEITGVRGLTAPFVLGYDVRNGTHCGSGAPRFNVRTTAGFYFLGACNNGTLTGAPQDPTEWTRARFDSSNPGQSFPVIPTGERVVSIILLLDEGTDETSPNDPAGVGLSVLDNIFINGVTITRGKNDDDDHDGRR